MEAWLTIITRQVILYSLPVVVTLSVTGMLEAAFLSRKGDGANHVHGPAWKGTWLPFAASILFGRAVIIAPPRPGADGPVPALYRLAAHIGLCLAGWLLYALALAHAPAMGLPPLHQWWAKVLMFFNLCMACLHLLPLPGMLAGEWLLPMMPPGRLRQRMDAWPVPPIALLAATPVLDIFPGRVIVFPVYEILVNQASRLAQ